VPDHRQPEFEGATIPSPPIPDDDGETSPELRRELDLLSTGAGSAPQVLDVLSRARLFVPVVAVLEEESERSDGPRSEKESSMATVLVDSPVHGRALLAFSGTATLATWRADARPVPVTAPIAARAAVSEAADALVVDVAGPTPFALTGTELLLMASLAAPPAGVVDPVLVRAVGQLIESRSPGEEARYGIAGSGADQPVEVWIEARTDESLRHDLLDRVSRDRVVAAVARSGVRVTFRDTP